MSDAAGPVISIHQPEFFPWAGYFNKILSCDRFVIFDNVQFKKHYYENRCRIMINGSANWLTVPILHKGRGFQRFCDVEINNATDWGGKVWKTVQQNYRKYPFWNDHAAFLEETFTARRWERLVDFNLHVIRRYCAYLDISFDFVLGSEICGDLTGSELVLDTCRRMGAGTYLSGRFGKDYLDEESFARAGITLRYQAFLPRPYRRPDGSESDPLSILDMTMVQGTGARDYIGGES